MPDYSQYGVPRPVPIGRQLQIEKRRSTNLAAIFAVGGVLVLCACMVLGIGAALYFLNSTQSAGNSAGLSLPFVSRSTSTPAESASPTPVPFLRAGKDESGLRLAVTAYQRPLPAQGITIPDGQELALITVRLDNTRTTGGPIKYASTDLALVSPEGDHFTPDDGQITTGSMLGDGEIEPGKSVTGDVVFYVYTDIRDLSLAWTSADGATRLFSLTR
jgi:Domain of unknown function (DUF4352)